MKGAEVFLKALYRSGIENIFGIVGGEAQAIKFNEENGINFFLTRHEFTAGIMADVYARLTGKPQMCYSTFGPGLTNLATGVFSAIQDRSPVLAVSAQIVQKDIAYNQTHQCLDNVSFMKTITKYSNSIDKIEDIPEIIYHAIDNMINEIPGPSYISFPLNIMQQTVEYDIGLSLINQVQKPNKRKAPLPNQYDLSSVYEKILQAEHPIIIVGNQIIREKLSTEVQKLSKAFNIPVISTLASKGVVPENDPLFIGSLNRYINDIYEGNLVEQIFDECDLLILLGYDFGEDLKPNLWNNKIETILLNSFYSSIDHVFKPSFMCVGDLEYSINYLLAQNIKQKNLSHNFYKTKSILENRLLNKNDIVPSIIHQVRSAIGNDGILCSDIGLHKQYAGLLSMTYEPNTFICSNVCGTFGFGLGASLAAKLSNPNKRVALICGDGGFHSNSQDLETAIRYNIPVVIVLLKDNAFGLIKHYQSLNKQDIYSNAVEFSNVDFVKLAQANGMDALQLQDMSELTSIMNNAFKNNKSLLIEIPIEYDYKFFSM